MKPNPMTWKAVPVLVATLCAFTFAAHASPPDRLLLPAASTATTDPFNGAAQLSAGNAAYARGDYVEAFHVYRNIAVLGISEAHYRLGLMYIDGLGTRKSLRQAEYWLKLAAAQNYPGAAEALASVRMVAAQG